MYTNSAIMTEVNSGFVVGAVVSCLIFALVVFSAVANSFEFENDNQIIFLGKYN